MKMAWRSLVLLTLLGAGCQSIPTLPVPWEDKKPAAPTPAPAVKPAVHREPVVTPDQVTEANAHEKAQALAEELDREANGTPAGTTKSH